MTLTKSRLEELRVFTEKAMPMEAYCDEIVAAMPELLDELERLKQNNLLEAVIAADEKMREENERLKAEIEQLRSSPIGSDFHAHMSEEIEKLTAENARLREKYDFQELVKREERLREGIRDIRRLYENDHGVRWEPEHEDVEAAVRLLERMK